MRDLAYAQTIHRQPTKHIDWHNESFYILQYSYTNVMFPNCASSDVWSGRGGMRPLSVRTWAFYPLAQSIQGRTSKAQVSSLWEPWADPWNQVLTTCSSWDNQIPSPERNRPGRKQQISLSECQVAGQEDGPFRFNCLWPVGAGGKETRLSTILEFSSPLATWRASVQPLGIIIWCWPSNQETCFWV